MATTAPITEPPTALHREAIALVQAIAAQLPDFALPEAAVKAVGQLLGGLPIPHSRAALVAHVERQLLALSHAQLVGYVRALHDRSAELLTLVPQESPSDGRPTDEPAPTESEPEPQSVH